MRILVTGVRLYFDVEGAQLRPDGDAMQQRPTLLLLHGGPGADHSLYKPAFSQLADIAQVVYLDHRGNGRSDRGAPDTWTLRQWADDVFAFCQALEIENPIVYGSSFGGTVAMAYAIHYPEHPGKLALVSTTAQARSHTAAKVAMFQRLGGRWGRCTCTAPVYRRRHQPRSAGRLAGVGPAAVHPIPLRCRRLRTYEVQPRMHGLVQPRGRRGQEL